MKAITSFVTRHPLVMFFSLACAFSWWPSLIEARSILPLDLLVAALIVTAIIGRWTGVKSFLGRVGEGAVVVAYAAVWAAAQRATSVAHRERMGSETAGCVPVSGCPESRWKLKSLKMGPERVATQNSDKPPVNIALQGKGRNRMTSIQSYSGYRPSSVAWSALLTNPWC